MDDSPESTAPESTPSPLPAAPRAHGAAGSAGWKSVWIVLTMVLALVAVPAGCNGMEALGRLAGVASEVPMSIAELAGLALAAAVVAVVGVVGLRRGWPDRWPARCILALVATASAVWCKVAVGRAYQESRDRMTLGCTRQVSAAADQFFLENPHRLFVQYDDLVGPDKYVKAYNPMEGEDLRLLFPMRRDLTDILDWVLTFPDGRQYSYPRTTPPKSDGVDVVKFPDGTRFEVTYHGGVADGPFRAYYPNGKPLSEATYVRGRVTGPVWIYTGDGRKLNELARGVDVEAAMQAGADTATGGLRQSAEKKLQAGDATGAIADLTKALEANPTGLSLYLERGDARMAAGDLDGAITDYCAGEGTDVATVARSGNAPAHVRDALLARGRPAAGKK